MGRKINRYKACIYNASSGGGGIFIKNKNFWDKTVDKADGFLGKKSPLFQRAQALCKEQFWDPLKRLLFIGVSVICVFCLAYAGYERLATPKSSSGRIYGEVRAVETDENGQIVLTVPYGETAFQESTLRVHIDQKTKVYSLYPEKVRISADEIRVGDIVCGVLRKGSEGLHDVTAKEISIETRADEIKKGLLP